MIFPSRCTKLRGTLLDRESRDGLFLFFWSILDLGFWDFEWDGIEEDGGRRVGKERYRPYVCSKVPRLIPEGSLRGPRRVSPHT